MRHDTRCMLRPRTGALRQRWCPPSLTHYASHGIHCLVIRTFGRKEKVRAFPIRVHLWFLQMTHSPDQHHRALSLELISSSASLLFSNGQTTEKMKTSVEELAGSLGLRVNVLPHWGELVLKIEDPGGPRCEILAVEPSGMDMNKVAEAMLVINQLCDKRLDAAAAQSALRAISLSPPASTSRFALMAAAG